MSLNSQRFLQFHPTVILVAYVNSCFIIIHRKENFIFFLTKLNDIIPLISNTLVIVDGAQGSTQRPAKPAPGD
jgi:hypothetical protein